MARTRFSVIAAILVLAVGIGAGLVAYYRGFPTGAFSQQSIPGELQLVPRNASLIAFANVHEVIASNFRERIQRAFPDRLDGQRQFEDVTGINIETDIDRLVACMVSPLGSQELQSPSAQETSDLPASALVIVRGRFNEARIETLMRDRGAQFETYKGIRLIVAGPQVAGNAPGPGTGAPDSGHGLSLAFVEPGLVAVGGTALVRRAIDLKKGGENVTTNDEMMDLVRSLDSGNLWAVGRFDALSSQASLGKWVARQLPSIAWFAMSGRVNGGIAGEIRAMTRDEESANSLRDVVRGIIALGRLQAASRPELEELLRSLQLGGTGTTVALEFEVHADLIDLLGTAATVQK